jgi:hypothetical protein
MRVSDYCPWYPPWWWIQKFGLLLEHSNDLGPLKNSPENYTIADLEHNSMDIDSEEWVEGWRMGRGIILCNLCEIDPSVWEAKETRPLQCWQCNENILIRKLYTRIGYHYYAVTICIRIRIFFRYKSTSASSSPFVSILLSDEEERNYRTSAAL